MAIRFDVLRHIYLVILLLGLTACQHDTAPSKATVTTGRADNTSSESKATLKKAHEAQVAKEAKAVKSAREAKAAKETAAAKRAKLKATTDANAKKAADNAAAKKAASKSSIAGSKVPVSPDYDEELRKIIDLARHNKWEEAESRASALYALDPKDVSVQRVYNWVKTEGPKRREKALEDKIRNVSSKETRFNPTLESIFLDQKSKGLPPRGDLREAIEQIKATPYIPDSFGKTVPWKGDMEDFNNNKGKMSNLLNKEIAVHLENVTLENIIFNVGQTEGINFIADKSIPAFQQKLSVNMKNVKLLEFLKYVSRNLGVQFQVGGDLIWIVDGKDTNKVQQETRFYHLRKGFVLPAQFGVSDAAKTTTVANNVTTVSEVQTFENFVRDGAAKEPSIAVAIRNFCEGLTYYVDYERNLIVASGSEEQLSGLEKVIEEFDRPVQQVLIEARFITVTEGTFLELGAAWETGRNAVNTARTPTDYTGLGTNPGLGLEETWTGEEMAGTNNWLSVMNGKSLTATLTAIDQSGESEVLSAPRVTVINNLPATINDGKIQYYYEEYKVNQTFTEQRSASTLVPSGPPSQVNSGVSLDVLASIGGDGKSIMLALNPQVNQDVQMVTFATVSDKNSQGQIASTFDIKLPQMGKQSLATRVMIKSGQTVAMGGVLQREQKTFVEAMPILGNIPILGAAFRRRTEVDLPRYLLVFVTATLLSENGEFIISSDAE
jgi:type IV pilus assembly protein PilQ